MRISDWSSDVCSSDLLAHRMCAVVDRFLDLVAGASGKRARFERFARDAELAAKLAALEHRAPGGVDEARARGRHHSSSPTSCARSRRNAVRRSRQWCSARQAVKAASAISAPKTISVAASGPTRGASTMIAPKANASVATDKRHAATKPQQIGRASCRDTGGPYG